MRELAVVFTSLELISEKYDKCAINPNWLTTLFEFIMLLPYYLFGGWSFSFLRLGAIYKFWSGRTETNHE